MSGYQFCHVSTFSKKGNSSSRSSSDILNENSRVPGHCDHVDNPLPARLLYGCNPIDVIPLLDARINEAKAALKGTGKRIQSNTHSLEGAVFSHPFVPADLENSEKKAEYSAWMKAQANFAIKEAKSRGMQVVSIVEHRDESHLHFHVLSIPFLTADNPRLDAKVCHAGHIAQRLAKDSGLGAKDQIKAYRKAMSDWQDVHYEAVSQHHGLTRIGPSRERLQRKAWHERKEAARQQAELLKRKAVLDIQVSNLQKTIVNAESIVDENTSLKKQRVDLTSEIKALRSDISDLKLESSAKYNDLVLRANTAIDEANARVNTVQSKLDEYERPRPFVRR
jgi:DNA repair exonuclease SbcCD ATPase subunit